MSQEARQSRTNGTRLFLGAAPTYSISSVPFFLSTLRQLLIPSLCVAAKQTPEAHRSWSVPFPSLTLGTDRRILLSITGNIFMSFDVRERLLINNWID